MDTDALQRLDSFLSDPKVPQEDKNRAVAMARTQDQTDTPLARAGQYLTHKGSEFIGAAQGVGKDVENLVTGQPYGTGFPGERSGWNTAGDVATTAAPIVAPEATALGLTTGTYARYKGADEPTADLVNAGTQLGSGLLRAGQAAAGVRGATSARFAGVRDALTQSGKLMAADSPEGQQLFWDLGRVRSRFPAGTGERQAATRIMGLLARGTGLTYGDVDDALTLVQGGKKASAVAGVLKGARRTIAAGTPEASDLAGAEQGARLNRMSLPNLLPSGGAINLQNLGRTGAVLGGLGEAGRQAYQGNYKRAAGSALGGLVGVGSVGQALAAAGPLARTAVAVGGQVPGLDLGGGGGGDETQPADIGTAAPAAPETPPPSPASPTARLQPLAGPYGREIAAVAHLAGVPGTLIQSHMKVESGGNASAIGDGGASIGLMQIQPGTAKVVAQHAGELLGRAPDLRNPFDNLLVGGLLLRRYLDQTDGDVAATAQKYNGGEHTSGNPMTRQYAGKIIENFRGGG